MLKKAVAIFFTLILVTPLFAVTLDDIIAMAKKESPRYSSILLSYENSRMDVTALEEGDKVAVAVTGTLMPMDNWNRERGVRGESTVRISFPDDGKSTVEGGITFSTPYSSPDLSSTVTLSASHTFDFTGYSSSGGKDIMYTQQKYSSELSFRRSELNFEKSVISAVSILISRENALLQSRLSVEKQRTSVEKIRALGTYSEDSAAFVNMLNTLSRLENALGAAESEYVNAAKSYFTLTGVEWDGELELSIPVLEVMEYSKGNTQVLLSALSAENAEENAKKTASLVDARTLSLSVGLSRDITGGETTRLTGSATYVGGSRFTLTVSPSFVSTALADTPSLTISGRWNSGNGENNQLKKAWNSVLVARNDYAEALSSYYSEADSLRVRVEEWKNTMAQAEGEVVYRKMMLDNAALLYEAGLIGESDYDDAVAAFGSAESQWKIAVLNGEALKRDLDVFAL